MDGPIALVAVNARYPHTSFGLRCLQANLGELEARSELLEFTINERAVDMVEKILSREPAIVGVGVYIWNLPIVKQIVSILRHVEPNLLIVLGGPEVSYEHQEQTWLADVDYVVCGEGEQVFRSLCEDLLQGVRPSLKIHQGSTPPMDELEWPYRLYSDEDVAHRVVYVEASRGCPYRCEFCLSSLDKKMREVPLDDFFEQMDNLLLRGASAFKFIDRTFNLSVPFALRVLSFFEERLRPGLSLHFEMVPERLPEALLEALARFPAGVVQLEIGVQTFDKEVARRISRPLKTEKISVNLRALHEQTQAHLHVDLIAGLPGESLAQFGAGFDRLHALGPHEIQLGILKRLKGTPLTRHTEPFAMVYSQDPPFEVLKTGALSFTELQEIKRFARYWDLVVNNGQFPQTSRLIWNDRESVFEAFYEFSEWLFRQSERTSHISLLKLAEYLLDFTIERRGLSEEEAGPVVVGDLSRTGGRRLPRRLQVFNRLLPPRERSDEAAGMKRQRRHQTGTH